MPTRLGELFLNHRGYLSDKWDHYLATYDSELSRFIEAGEPVDLLEIGVQNGGSLQLWSRYLPPGSHIVGIDIDPACVSLRLPDNVSVLIGDASDPATVTRLLADRTFQVIIDDGSHRSDDIITAFEVLFERLTLGGLYVAEDLHCSYLSRFGGGYRQPGAAVEWFKDLVEAINFDHIQETTQVTAGELRRLGRLNRSIARVAFYDSIAVIEKLAKQKTQPYRRVMSGRETPVANPAAAVFAMAPSQVRAISLSPALSDVLSPVWTDMLATAKEDLATSQADLAAARQQANEAAKRSEARIQELDDALAAAQENIANLQQEGNAARTVAERERAALQVQLDRQRIMLATKDHLLGAATASRQRIMDLEAALSVTAHELAAVRAELVRAGERYEALEDEHQRAEALMDAFATSTCWKITAPIRIIRRGLMREPEPLVALPPPPPPAVTVPVMIESPPPLPPPVLMATDAVRARFPQLQPLRVFRVPGRQRRVTMVTDSINAGSLFGGVGTAIVLAATLARHMGASLRLVTRTEPAEAANFATVMQTHRVAVPMDVTFAYAPAAEDHELDVSDADIFLTTSWWTTRAVREVIDPSRIVYLLQEDERMFYPNGDDRLRCQETLSDDAIRVIVNSRMLFEHLVNGPEPLPHLARRGTWFEPAFPAFASDDASQPPTSAKRNFFFYARPNNVRNLYWSGLQAISESIEDGILDPEAWDFHFAGRDLAAMELPCGVRPVLHQNLPWPDYVALIRTIDVGLSLMATPHPSYPPLDLAAAGAMVVTNRYGGKLSLDQYASTIICVDPSISALKQGIAEAVNRAGGQKRIGEADGILRDWDVALKPVLDRFFAELTTA